MLALTNFSAVIGLVAMAFIVALFLFVIPGRTLVKRAAVRPPAWQVVVVFALEAVGRWHGLYPFLPAIFM